MLCVGPTIHTPVLNVDPVCTCVPDGGHVAAAVNPLPDALTIAGAVVQGNISQAYGALGSLAVKSSCPTCAVALNSYASSKDKAVVEEIIGRGLLIFISATEPELMLVDAGGNSSQSVPLTAAPPPPIAASAAPRAAKTYIVTGANCAIVHAQKAAAAGWIDPPSLVDSTTHAVSLFPNVDLRTGDTLMISSNDACKVVPSGDSHVSSLNMIYDHQSVVTGPAPEMKYFFVGNAT